MKKSTLFLIVLVLFLSTNVFSMVVHVQFSGNTLSAYDSTGNVLWKFSARSNITVALVDNVDGKPGTEVLVGTDSSGDDRGMIYLLDSSGKLLWSFQTGATGVFWPDNKYVVVRLIVADVDKDGVNEVISLSYQNTWYPERLCVIDGRNGKLKGEFWNPGRSASPDSLAVADLDNDGIMEIIVGSGNNDLGFIGAVYCLKGNLVIGQAPPYYGEAQKGSFVWYTQLGKPANDPFVHWVEVISDVDGDGVRDLRVGGGNKSRPNFVKILSGKSGQEISMRKASGWHFLGYDLFNTKTYPYRSSSDLTSLIEAWSSVNSELLLTGDINGDGSLELVFSNRNTLYVFSSSGKGLWKKDIRNEYGLEIRHMNLVDVNKDNSMEIIIGLSLANGRRNPAKILTFSSNGSLINAINLPDCEEFTFVVDDINNDEKLEVIATIIVGYPLKPRGIYVYDYASGKLLWNFNYGPMGWVNCVHDIDGDGKKEIFVGTFAPHNGNAENGTTDFESFVFAFKSDGKILWIKKIGTDAAFCSLTDLDGDGNLELIVFRNQGAPWYPGLNQIIILDPKTGETRKTYTGPSDKIWKGWAIADLNNDGKNEIISANHDGVLRILDYKMDLIKIRKIACSVQAVADLVGDQRKEIVVLTDDGKVQILDADLNTLFEYSVSKPIMAIVSDLIPGGSSEIIISGAKTFVLTGGN